MFIKNIKKILILSILVLVTGCGLVPSGYMGHSTNTQVILSEANYKSLDMELRVNKYVTSFEYLHDEISSDKNNY